MKTNLIKTSIDKDRLLQIIREEIMRDMLLDLAEEVMERNEQPKKK